MKSYRLIDIVDLIGGGTPKTNNSDYWGGNIPWISVKDLGCKGRYVKHTEKSITEAGLENSSTRMLQEDDIVLSARGTVGEMAMLSGPMAFNQSCFGIRGKKEILDQTYLYYLLKNNLRRLKNHSYGSVFDTITRNTFADIEVTIPDISQQKKVAGVLSRLDDKISLNENINDYLEQIAYAMYSNVVKAACTSSNAHRVKLSDILSIKYGKDHKKLQEGDIPVYGSGGIMRYVDSALYEGESVLIPRKGTLNNVFYTNCPFWSVDTMFYSVMKRPYVAKYVYFFIQSLDLASMNEGSAVPSMTKEKLYGLELLVPAVDEIKQFDDTASLLFIQKERNIIQNETLSTIRDMALSRLLSGNLTPQITPSNNHLSLDFPTHLHIMEQNKNRVSVESVDEYLYEICRLREENIREEKENRHGDETVSSDSRFFFRGQENINWGVSPTIFRNNLTRSEDKIVKKAYDRRPQEFRQTDSVFERLSKLQHYGLNTRLLDVTTNPLVALFFACRQRKDGNGEPVDGVVLFKWATPIRHESIEVKVLSILAETEDGAGADEFLDHLVVDGVYSKESAEKVRGKDSQYTGILNILRSSYFVLSNQNNDRLIRQSGGFLISGEAKLCDGGNGKIVIRKDCSDLGKEFSKDVFCIPGDCKEDIMDQLNLCEINKASLFPELEHQMSYVNECYSAYASGTVYFSSPDDGAPRDINLSESHYEDVMGILFEIVEKHSLSESVYKQIVQLFEQNTSIVDWWKRETILGLIRRDIKRVLREAKYSERESKSLSDSILDDLTNKIERK